MAGSPILLWGMVEPSQAYCYLVDESKRCESPFRIVPVNGVFAMQQMGGIFWKGKGSYWLS